jgi:hypothetical protein
VKVAKDESNPLRVLNGTFKPDAHEEFGHLPNGLWAYGLFDAKGVRQDSAPDFVGPDTTAHGRDGRIHVGLSCVRCHGRNGGINDIDGWARGLFKGKLALQSPDQEELRKLKRLYLQPLEDSIDDDRRIYRRAVKRINGWSPETNTQEYTDFFAVYDAPVDGARAAVELGVTVGTLEKALDKEIKEKGSLEDIPLAAFLQDRTIPVTTWHESYAGAQRILYRHRKDGVK